MAKEGASLRKSMASRDRDDVLRDLRRTSDLVLVQRRSAVSRKTRGRLCKDKKGPRSSTPGAAGTPADWEPPGAERSTAKGKRPWTLGCRCQHSDCSSNSLSTSPGLHIRRPTQSAGHSSPAGCSPIRIQSSSPKKCLRVAPEANEEQVAHLPPWACFRENVVCTHPTSSGRSRRLSPNRSVLRPPVCPQGCVSSPESIRVTACQDITSTGQYQCLPHSPGEVRCRTVYRNELVETSRTSVPERGEELDIACSATPSKSVWLDWQSSGTCSVPNVVSSRVSICSYCCQSDQVIGSENVSGSSACDRTVRISPRNACSDSVLENPGCGVQPRKRLLQDHHVIVNLGSDVPDCGGSNSTDRTYSCTCSACPCPRCRQRRLLSGASPLTVNVLNQPDQFGTSCTVDVGRQVCHRRISDSFAFCHSPSEIAPTPPSSCSQEESHCSRMVRMRYVGRCLLLLVLIGIGGLLAHVTVTDVSDGHNAGVGGAVGVGVVLGGNYRVGMLMKIPMRPVPVKEFQDRLRTVRNKFDLLRIFVADKDISDESLTRLLTAAMASHSSHTMVHTDVREIAVASRSEDVDANLAAVSQSDLHIEDSREERTHSEVLETEGLSEASQQSESRNTTGKDGNESANAMTFKENPGKISDPEDNASMTRTDKSRRDLPKREIPLSKQTNNREDGGPHNVGTSTARSPTTTLAQPESSSQPVNADTGELSTQLELVREKDTSPSGAEIGAEISAITKDVTQDTLPSNFRDPDVTKSVTKDPSPSSLGVSGVTKDPLPSSLKVPDINKVDHREIIPSSSSEGSDVDSDDKGSVSSNLKVSEVSQDSNLDEAQLAKVHKRAEPMYDDVDYLDDVEEEDYIDGEVDYYNDAAHTDAILEELEEAVHHISEMENNPQAVCRDPLPQVVYIEDPKKQNRQFYPECTVIHRCRNDSGCCGRNYECGPKYEQVIFRTFLAVTLNTTSLTVLPDTRMVERIALVNHTECQCREKTRLPDCTQSCPGVFRMYRYGSHCVCDCQSSANERFPQCDDVKEGLYPLSHDDLVCIKSGKCGRPRCAVGQFDVSSGFCPLKDLYSIPNSLLTDRLRRQYQQRRQRSHHDQHGPPASSSVPVEGSGDF